MSAERILELERKIGEMQAELNGLQKGQPGVLVPNYRFETLNGSTTLRELFGDQEKLLAIHNMGQGCRYCTLWADGFNGLLEHLESAMAVVLLSKDSPYVQRQFANSRGWRFRLASHGGGQYMKEQSVFEGGDNYPGSVFYERNGEELLRKNSAAFGPGDLYCSMWPLLGLAGLGDENWTPQYSYWRRPDKLDDGGGNLLD